MPDSDKIKYFTQMYNGSWKILLFYKTIYNNNKYPVSGDEITCSLITILVMDTYILISIRFER